MLNILQTRRAVTDPYTKKSVKLPPQKAGQLMVFKVSAQIAYALVMDAERPIHVLDLVEKPDPVAGH